MAGSCGATIHVGTARSKEVFALAASVKYDLLLLISLCYVPFVLNRFAQDIGFARLIIF